MFKKYKVTANESSFFSSQNEERKEESEPTRASENEEDKNKS